MNLDARKRSCICSNEYNHPAKTTGPGLIPKDPVDYISLDGLMKCNGSVKYWLI